MRIFLLILISLFLQYATAGNGNKEKAGVKHVAGKVYTSSGEELSAVKITIRETNETFFADLNGQFSFQLKSDKAYTIAIEGLGYEPLVLPSSSLTLFSEIILKELQ